MANFKEVNKAIAANTDLDIQARRGDGYVYFDGDDGWDKISSIYVHPVNTDTDVMIELCLRLVTGGNK